MVHPTDKIRYRHLFTNSDRPKPLRLRVSADIHVVVFSDAHLTACLDTSLMSKFRSMIEEADLVIINGDFWFDQETTFDEFVQSAWSELFPLLRAKHAIYLFGNHDMPQFSDERIRLFCDREGFELDLTAGDLRFHIEHGHIRSSPLVRQVLKLFEGHPRLLGRLTAPFGLLSDVVLQSSKRPLKRISKRVNARFKHHYVHQNSDVFVMGHTHVPEVDVAAKYINLGRTHGTDFSYLTIVGNQYTLHRT